MDVYCYLSLLHGWMRHIDDISSRDCKSSSDSSSTSTTTTYITGELRKQNEKCLMVRNIVIVSGACISTRPQVSHTRLQRYEINVLTKFNVYEIRNPHTRTHIIYTVCIVTQVELYARLIYPKSIREWGSWIVIGKCLLKSAKHAMYAVCNVSILHISHITYSICMHIRMPTWHINKSLRFFVTYSK